MVISLGKMVVEGLEWYNLLGLVNKVLNYDDNFRENGETILRNRDCVEKAKEELEDIPNRVRKWRLYVETSLDSVPLNTFVTTNPEWLKKQYENVEFCVPNRARIDMDKEGVSTGIADICCKIKGLNDVDGIDFKEGIVDFADRFWNRCHLHSRRSVGAYDFVPDSREDEFREGAKLVYDLEELEK